MTDDKSRALRPAVYLSFYHRSFVIGHFEFGADRSGKTGGFLTLTFLIIWRDQVCLLNRCIKSASQFLPRDPRKRAVIVQLHLTKAEPEATRTSNCTPPQLSRGI